MDEFGAFLGGVVLSALLIIAAIVHSQPEIKREEIYRFCLVKKIPLEECEIPKRPYKEEVK